MIKTIVLDIEPVPKPRMTSSDRWNKRPCVQRYWAYKHKIKHKLPKNFKMPECRYHLIFYIPMPKSWSGTKRAEMMYMPHQQTPDKDNLEKAFLDAVCEEDKHVWDGRVSKYWGEEGFIVLRTDLSLDWGHDAR